MKINKIFLSKVQNSLIYITKFKPKCYINTT